MSGIEPRILLVSHAESVLNVDQSLTRDMADHAVPLTERGFRQARLAGEFIREHLRDDAGPGRRHVRLWHSPYKRARQTADIIGLAAGGSITDRREHINLADQQLGLFDGIPEDELPRRFPAEYAHYHKCEQHAGRFWARMPLGESRFDVALRVRQFFPVLVHDVRRHGIQDLIVVSHGVTLRAFLMQWLHLTPEWFEAEANPANASVRLVEGERDCGYIYRGAVPRPIDGAISFQGRAV